LIETSIIHQWCELTQIGEKQLNNPTTFVSFFLSFFPPRWSCDNTKRRYGHQLLAARDSSLNAATPQINIGGDSLSLSRNDERKRDQKKNCLSTLDARSRHIDIDIFPFIFDLGCTPDRRRGIQLIFVVDDDVADRL
jgi:hypothetical protein